MNPGPLAEFLRAKRRDLAPERARLASYGARRRVQGLRREEVAQLAGISIGYYTRLEQGHSRHASDEVLLALANALQLTVTETEHLLDLSRARIPVVGLTPPAEEVADDAALSMLEFVGERPAVLLGRRNDVLAWNRLGHALIAPHLPYAAPLHAATRPSLPRMVFLDPVARALYRDWHAEAADYVAYLRMISGKHPDDRTLASLVGELLMKDSHFAELWTAGRVGECVAGTKRLHHPTAGDVGVRFQLWAQASCPEHRVEVYDFDDADRVVHALRTVPITGLAVSGASDVSPARGKIAKR